MSDHIPVHSTRQGLGEGIAGTIPARKGTAG